MANHKSLAVKYRPRVLDEICEQGSIVSILRNQIETKSFKNTALFCGPSGCGKTTAARAFAKELNSFKGTVIEIDAASNNGVENVRDILVRAQQKALDAEYKVFILDEAHMLSTGAWNAFLKIIEEPPAKTVFLFCTTDPQKIPATIHSRVQRFDFKKLTFKTICERLSWIVEQENANNNKCSATVEAVEYVAKLADGGMRDAITMLDTCLAFNPNVTLQTAIEALGTVDYNIFFDLFFNIVDAKDKEVIVLIETVFREGVDLKQFIKLFTNFLLDLSKYYMLKTFDYIQIPNIYKNRLDECVFGTTETDGIPLSFVKKALFELNAISNDIKWVTNPKPLIELKLINLSING